MSAQEIKLVGEDHSSASNDNHVSDQPGIRLLRKIDVRPGITGLGDLDRHTTTALVVDVETTGLDQETDVVIELAMRRFRYDDDGTIVEIGRGWSWRQDPGFPLSPEIIELTGLTDADLASQSIDDDVVHRIVAEAGLIIAHNAAFDRPMLEKRFPDMPGRPWACSCDQIDWRAAGFEGRSLGYLAMQAGGISMVTGPSTMSMRWCSCFSMRTPTGRRCSLSSTGTRWPTAIWSKRSGRLSKRRMLCEREAIAGIPRSVCGGEK